MSGDAFAVCGEDRGQAQAEGGGAGSPQGQVQEDISLSRSDVDLKKLIYGNRLADHGMWVVFLTLTKLKLIKTRTCSPFFSIFHAYIKAKHIQIYINEIRIIHISYSTIPVLYSILLCIEPLLLQIYLFTSCK